MTARRGFTLVETIVGMMIIGISFYLLMTVFITITPKTNLDQDTNTKTFLAQEVLEEYLAKGFAALVDVSPTAFPAPFNNYSYRISVKNVQAGDLNTDVGLGTNYKNVTAYVWGGNLSGTYEITTLDTTY
ncbi:hypothetical protein A2311_01875 [candidate division WOR-1 bacterium RIFOXYB2_FULL_48_7]|uniref:Type II secretion system protein GspG C-terminal domain-containing protein n=1 Tax=candidate division WOR-1 bacterium RIFOXYB2_FULL_48_7 TaxID=1802583 RepID=A0A1F4TNM6_UNCSA|nr:MAG: hypothetical protein A2311_01875 [candidate division WOR-1 bacterium RIFOXYB2_FULL_48_7]